MAGNLEDLTQPQRIELKSLHHARGNIQRQITHFNNLLDSQISQAEGPDVVYLQAAFETLLTHWNRFDQIQNDIEAIIDSESEIEKGFDLQNRYHLAIAKYRKIVHPRPAERDHSSENDSIIHEAAARSQPQSHAIAVKLPSIPLPTFNGTYEDWAPFYDLFISLIDKNDNLLPVQKLQYLRSAVSGKAAKVISSLETTDINYNAALEILKKKYECTRKVVLKHWAAIREIPRIQIERLDALGDLVDSTRQHLRALENLKEPIDKWDTPIIDMLLLKLPKELTTQWELTISGNKIPKYEDLLTFLETRANCSEFTVISQHQHHSDRFTKHLRNSKQSRVQALATSTHQTPTYRGCPICAQPHKIYSCPAFQKMAAEERNKAVSSASLCFNCLAWGHNTKNCLSKHKCQNCGNKHHTLLHAEKTSTQESHE